MSCDERSGFLFAHACDRPAVFTCGTCGKGVCELHTRMLEQGPACVGCARQQPAYRDQQYAETDDPYFYSTAGTGYYYDADDYGAFDTSSAPDAGGESDFEADAGGS